jgi:hypothetical protein
MQFFPLPGARILLTAAAVACASAALPPGYDEELYCPAGACRRSKEQPDGFTGPRSSFNECFEADTGFTSQPRAWGDNLGIEYKESLVTEGHTQWICGSPPPGGVPAVERSGAGNFFRWCVGAVAVMGVALALVPQLIPMRAKRALRLAL